jgi:hypothetical protein
MSNFWKEVNIEQVISNTSIKKIEKGTNTLFWRDRWLSDCSLKYHPPMLFDLASNKNVTLAQVIEYNKLYLNINRPLNDILRQQLNSLYNTLSTIVLNTTKDTYVCS